MRLGVISDTHGAVENTRAAVRMLESLEIDALVHCGDIGTPEVIALLAGWPTHYVGGNCDNDPAPLRRAIAAAGQTWHGEFGEIELAGVRVALAHGHDSRRLADAIKSGSYQLVCTGHTHQKRIEQVGQTLVLNPGALYRANPHSLALVDLPELSAMHINL
ncbi:metallophosphoesterase family protein [Botrimarina hoheduenensis]|uniref:Phosphoesterase n=1 Tax=Botrimarina hoheduenensis TaxID=2528000 RepID=A0A5C5W7Q9_9BACT|nr:YfcE family phosphodiesterase [Botrimarina hoheduenensis]TWT46938.1 hypothetical protein Pla111_20400 [Botrimarina hoheduenensis]